MGIGVFPAPSVYMSVINFWCGCCWMNLCQRKIVSKPSISLHNFVYVMCVIHFAAGCKCMNSNTPHLTQTWKTGSAKICFSWFCFINRFSKIAFQQLLYAIWVLNIFIRYYQIQQHAWNFQKTTEWLWIFLNKGDFTRTMRSLYWLFCQTNQLPVEKTTKSAHWSCWPHNQLITWYCSIYIIVLKCVDSHNFLVLSWCKIQPSYSSLV